MYRFKIFETSVSKLVADGRLPSWSSASSSVTSRFEGVEMIDRGDSFSRSSKGKFDCGDMESFRGLGSSKPFPCNAISAADFSGARNGRMLGGDNVAMIQLDYSLLKRVSDGRSESRRQ